MNKKFAVIIVITWLVFGIAGISRGDGTGSPEIYKVAIAKFELSSDGGNSYITIFEGTSDYIDIASVSGGQKAGNFLNGLNVPDGTYTHVRVTPSSIFKMKGSAVNATDSTTYYTTAGTTAVGAHTGSTATTTAGNLAEGTMTLSAGTITATVNALSPNVVVRNGVANHSVRVSFDVANTLDMYDNGGNEAFLPSVPTVIMAVK